MTIVVITHIHALNALGQVSMIFLIRLMIIQMIAGAA